MKYFLAVDPGFDGAFVLMDEKGKCEFFEMPVEETKKAKGGKKREFIWDEILEILVNAPDGTTVLLERASAFNMGATGAFNYGRGFAMLEIAIKLADLPVIHVEPAKWSKWAHAGIDSNLKAKAKSLIALQRLYPKLYKTVPRSPVAQNIHEGIVDAILIAGYGWSR